MSVSCFKKVGIRAAKCWKSKWCQKEKQLGELKPKDLRKHLINHYKKKKYCITINIPSQLQQFHHINHINGVGCTSNSTTGGTSGSSRTIIELHLIPFIFYYGEEKNKIKAYVV